MKIFSVISLLSIPVVSGFATPPAPKVSTALHATQTEGLRKAAVSFMAAAFLASNLAVVDPAVAMDDMSSMDFGSSQVLAGRSGGRAGGRSSAARAPSRPSTTSQSSSTRVIERTTYVQPSPVIVAPPMYGYGYNPVPGLGLSLGLNTLNQIGNDMRDYRQESEIAQTRAQLQNSQMREAELEARIRQLEMANQNNQLSQQQQQQLMQLRMLNQQVQGSK